MVPLPGEMTASGVQGRAGKRDRLVSAATELLHRQGLQATTLLQIAEAAGVPAGNVYYYFKTRDDLVRAVIDSWAHEIEHVLDSIGKRPTARARLKALARTWIDQRDIVAEAGCPIGSLCTELNKQEGGLDTLAGQLVTPLIEWATAQFREMGRPDAEDLALTFLSIVEGASLMANNLRDPEILSRQIRRLEKWIDTLG